MDRHLWVSASLTAPARSDPDGSSPFGIPMSMWEQLTGLFDVRPCSGRTGAACPLASLTRLGSPQDENDTTATIADVTATAAGGHAAAPAAPAVDVGQSGLTACVNPGFGAGHLDTTNMFDAGLGALMSAPLPATPLTGSLTRVANRFATLGQPSTIGCLPPPAHPPPLPLRWIPSRCVRLMLPASREALRIV